MARSKTVYIKKFSSRVSFESEIAGYEFVKSYYESIPKLIEYDRAKKEIAYQNIRSDINITISDAVNDNRLVDLRGLFQEQANIVKRYIRQDAYEGGSRLFYRDRIDRMTTAQNEYDKFINDVALKVTINNIHVDRKNNLTYLQNFLLSLEVGYVVPSNGDFHERNIFTNGNIVDFEGGGWNLLSTDIVTFVHHILFAGNYFGPKYAKWANGHNGYEDHEIDVIGNDIIVQLSSARSSILSQYEIFFLKNIGVKILKELDYQLCMLMAVRLLTVFDVSKMSEKDQMVTFALVQFFLDNEKSFLEKIRLVKFFTGA